MVREGLVAPLVTEVQAVVEDCLRAYMDRRESSSPTLLLLSGGLHPPPGQEQSINKEHEDTLVEHQGEMSMEGSKAQPSYT